MSKVSLVVCEGYGNQGAPRLSGTEKIIDLKMRVPETQDIMGVIREDFDPESSGDKRMSAAIDPVIRYERINNLVGKLLTLVDAAFIDIEQRKAMKDLVTQNCWDWYTSQQQEVVSVWQKNNIN